MSQNWVAIPSSTTIQASRQPLLDRTESLKSCFSGTSFPASNLVVGMFCFRTDENKLYQLKATTPTWVLIADLGKTYISVEDANALYRAIGWTPAASEIAVSNTGMSEISGANVQALFDSVDNDLATKYDSWADVSAVIPTNSNAHGGKYSSTAAPSGGANGDLWYRYS